MKRIFSIFAFALGCIMCAMANSEYRVEIDLGTKEVTVVKDGVAIQGTRHVSPASALLKLSKSTNQEIKCELLSLEDADFSCRSYSWNGNTGFHKRKMLFFTPA